MDTKFGLSVESISLNCFQQQNASVILLSPVDNKMILLSTVDAVPLSTQLCDLRQGFWIIG